MACSNRLTGFVGVASVAPYKGGATLRYKRYAVALATTRYRDATDATA